MEIDEEEVISQTTKTIAFNNAVRRMSGQAFIGSSGLQPSALKVNDSGTPSEEASDKLKFEKINASLEKMVKEKIKEERRSNMNVPSSLRITTWQKNLFNFCVILSIASLTLLLTALDGSSSTTLQVFRIICLIFLLVFNLYCISKIYIYTLTIKRSTRKVYLREGFLFEYLSGRSYYMDFLVEDIYQINIQRLEAKSQDEGVLYRNCIQLFETEKRLYTLGTDEKSLVLHNTSKIYRYLNLLKEEGYVKTHAQTQSRSWLNEKVNNILYLRHQAQLENNLNEFTNSITQFINKKKDNNKDIKTSQDKIAKAS